MKKLILLCLIVSSASVLCAEELKFVTLLSQPVGSFATVDLLDKESPAEIFHLNFCNTSVSAGNITVAKGAAEYPVHADKLQVNAAATLAGSVPNFALSDSLTIGTNSSGSFTGGSLEADEANPSRILVSNSSGSSGSAAFLTSTVNTHVASFYKMNIAGTAVLNTPASGSTRADDLAWKVISCSSSSSDNSAACSAQLLTNATNAGAGADCSNRTYKLAHKSTCCASAPQTDTDCYSYQWMWETLIDYGECYSGGDDERMYNTCVDSCNVSEACTASNLERVACQCDYCNGVLERRGYVCSAQRNGW